MSGRLALLLSISRYCTELSILGFEALWKLRRWTTPDQTRTFIVPFRIAKYSSTWLLRRLLGPASSDAKHQGVYLCRDLTVPNRRPSHRWIDVDIDSGDDPPAMGILETSTCSSIFQVIVLPATSQHSSPDPYSSYHRQPHHLSCLGSCIDFGKGFGMSLALVCSRTVMMGQLCT